MNVTPVLVIVGLVVLAALALSFRRESFVLDASDPYAFFFGSPSKNAELATAMAGADHQFQTQLIYFRNRIAENPNFVRELPAPFVMDLGNYRLPLELVVGPLSQFDSDTELVWNTSATLLFLIFTKLGVQDIQSKLNPPNMPNLLNELVDTKPWRLSVNERFILLGALDQ